MATNRGNLVGKQIRKARKEKGWTQEKLAELVGVTPKYIQYIETGRRSPSLKIIYKLVSKLGLKTLTF